MSTPPIWTAPWPVFSTCVTRPGTSKIDPDAHGSGFDRVSAFQDGYDNGLDRCKDYRDDEPMVLALPFNDQEDASRGGDAPYDSIVNGVPYDIEDYFTQLYPEISNGQQWTPLQAIEPFDPANPPMCGDQSAEGYALFYCVPEDYVGWDNVDAMPEVYKQGGDYAVVTLLATQWGLAALTRLGDESDVKTSTLRGGLPGRRLHGERDPLQPSRDQHLPHLAG